MSEPRKEQLAEGVTLCLGDCEQLLPSLGPFDAAVLDPPLWHRRGSGQGEDAHFRPRGEAFMPHTPPRLRR